MIDFKEITVFTNGNSEDPEVFSNVPYFLTGSLIKKEIKINRINIGANRFLEFIYKLFILSFVKLIHKETSYIYFRSSWHAFFVKHRIRKAIKQHPEADALIFLTYSLSASELTQKPVVLLGDWPYEYVFHKYLDRKPDYFEKQAIKREKRNIENSTLTISLFPGVVEYMKNRYVTPRIHYLGNVINALIEPVENEILPLKEQSKLILFIGRERYLDAASCLVSSFKSMQNEYPDLTLHIIGLEGKSFPDHPANVFFHGYLDKGDKSQLKLFYDLLKNSKIFINTDPQWGAFSASLETMYFYTPVIVSPYNEFVNTFGKNIQFGLFCEENRPEILADKIKQVFNAPNYADLCKKAHDAAEQFTWEKFTSNLLSALNQKILFITLTIIWSFCFPSFSQDSINYRVETFGSIASQDLTPFWMVNNTYGMVPIQSGNAYLRGKTDWYHYTQSKFRFNAAIDLVGAYNHSSSFFIQQLYGEVAYRSLQLTIGSKEYYTSILDKKLSSGDMDYSTNARPIPEINLSVPNFTKIPYTKDRLYFKGDFAVGKSTDNNYILRTKYPGSDYAIDLLWHHKSLYFLLKDPQEKFPFEMIFGLEHAAQWGGWTSFMHIGELPHSFSDFIRIVLGEHGGEDSDPSDQKNALGNHQGTLDIKINYHSKPGTFSIYKQHFYDDRSGLEFANWRDGIWGLEYEPKKQKHVRKLVFEYINTTNQSGPIHFLYYDRPSRGGGNDDYYNHDYYISGWSHWGRSLGTPLITSPDYSSDGKIFFQNNRVKAWHLGIDGKLNDQFDYRVLGTYMNTWGRMTYPFLSTKHDFSMLLESDYSPNRWKGWKIGAQLAWDQGTLYRNNWGSSLKISKSGLIK